uniref:C3H1-type domain-containing protein n=1 Tax=Alexandrium monilatum TaxID=311494 RepID=A0A7S4QIU1_9DINO|mmetsp:Transcript_27878/g.88114  ORF Transcript_27878/g.88114 Transcript_27878/m.88114 type:complete len:749 (+) Transcript_27878:110-2356(+)
MLMLPPFPAEAQGQGSSGMAAEALPVWQEVGELGDHRQYIFHYHTMMCPQFANGYCPRHKGSRSAPPQCFCYHFESQRRRPLVDTLTGQLRYWDVLCEHVAEGEECPCGDLCPFAHTREEISYHAAKYKTKICNDRDCRGQEVCCFAHGESELRRHALERYSYWSAWPAGTQGGPRLSHFASDVVLVAGSGLGAAGGRGGSTGALYHPKVYKHRFCASYPHVVSCRRGDSCAFAHSREEIRTPLLAAEEEEQRPSALTNDFFMYRFKTLWCPVGVQHDWQTCVYAHNYQDARRHPGIGYGPRPCPYWKRKETSLEYSQRCPLGVRCPFSHGAKEQLYHPAYFKTVTCQDWPNSNCPRSRLCAFWHKRSQQRARPSSEEEFNYKFPIPEQRLEDALQVDFLSPPFKLLNTLQAEPGQTECAQGQGDDAGFATPETASSPPLSMWAPALCRFNSGGTPTTPTTIADCDEAASADSGSDKIPAAVPEEGGIGGVPGPGQAMDAAQAAEGCVWSGEASSRRWMDEEAGPPWGYSSWAGEGLAMPGFGSQFGAQMMCYMQVPPAGGPDQTVDPSAGHAACGDGASGGQALHPPLHFGDVAGGPPPLGLPQDALTLPGGFTPDRPFAQPLDSEAVTAPPLTMPMWWGGPLFPEGDSNSYGFNPLLMGYGSSTFTSSVELPDSAEIRFGEVDSVEALRRPTAIPGEPGVARETGEAWAAPESSMPTHNGFIHFKDADGPDPESPPAGRRPRANSH